MTSSPKEPLVIGFDAKRVVSNRTGLGNYGRTLINALSKDFPAVQLRLYTPGEGQADLRQQVESRPNVVYAYPKHVKLKFLRSLWRTKGIVADLKEDGINLYHGLSGELPIGIKKAGIKTVVTIHDLIFLRHPEYYNRIDVQIYKYKFRKTLKEADRIIAISECTKRDILEYGQFPADKIDVIYQSCGTQFSEKVSEGAKATVRKKYQLPEHYILNVGTIEERKNILLAVKALEHLPKELKLVVVGRKTPYTDKVKAYITAHQLTDRVLFLSGVPTSDLFGIYQQAEVFVYPSRYEGFGIPIIEAIQSGLPVVACSGSCLEEAGGPDCLYVAPDDAEGMSKAIKMFLPDCQVAASDGRRGMADNGTGNLHRRNSIEKSGEYVKRFENTDVSRQVYEEYKRLITFP